MMLINDRLRRFIHNFMYTIIFVLTGIFIPHYRYLSLILVGVTFCFNLLDFILSMDKIKLADFDGNNPQNMDAKKSAELSNDNRFLNEIMEYAKSKGLEVSIDFSENKGPVLISYIQDLDSFEPVDTIIFPGPEAKYGSDAYQSVVHTMYEKIDKYVNIRNLNKKGK